jgi:hypothetical protein
MMPRNPDPASRSKHTPAMSRRPYGALLAAFALVALLLASCAPSGGSGTPLPVIQIATPDATPSPSTPATGGTYRVVAGDTLAEIARRFHTTVATLARLNHLSNVDQLTVGQVLRLPAASGASASPTPLPSPSMPPLPPPAPPGSTPSPSGGTRQTVWETQYAAADNDPAGSRAIAYPGPAPRHMAAGGSGTYSNPLTLASDAAWLPVGTRVYAPRWHKYYIMEDDCVECDADWRASHFHHVDLYMANSVQAGVIACENVATKSQAENDVIILNPPAGLPTDPTPLYTDSGGCVAANHQYSG